MSARLLIVAVVAAFFLTSGVFASASAGNPDDGLTSFDILLLGMRAHPEPETQVVPRNTATGLHVALEFGAGAGGNGNQDVLLALLPSGLEIAAELVGPGIASPIALRSPPGKLLPIPPLVERGHYLVRDIRLELDGELLLRAAPDSATIEVIERVLITQVTTRPLDAEEIRQKGIIFGDENFKAFTFTLALKLDSRPVNIDFDAVFDANDVLVPTRPNTSIDLQGSGGSISLPNAQFQPVLLKLSLPDATELDLPEDVPDVSIPGLLVIPGDVGFLNQFFSAMLIVSNGAPLGSGLSVRDLTGTIQLPPGDDAVAGTADDPLALAATTSGQTATIPIVGLGPDGVLGTSDDRGEFQPGGQGQSEYLLEGKKEGFHHIDFDIAGTLDGLPVGPVNVTGTARGGVVVRNPYFNVTFSAPRTVRLLEEFTLFVNVTNTSGSLANFVNVTLSALQLSGAELLSSSTLTIDTLEPDDSETLRFRFRSLRNGEVTASYLNFDPGGGASNDGDLEFHLSLGERGTPLSPDTIVLPTAVEALPTSVVDQALRVLGQAWSIATAPEGTLAEGVIRVSKQATVDRAIEVAEAGLRVQLGEDVSSSLTSLGFTWLSTADAGFEQILRETKAGEAFWASIGNELQDAANDPIATFHETLSSRLTSRPPHLLFSVANGAGVAPVTWKVTDGNGNASANANANALRIVGAAGSEDLVQSDVPNAAYLPLTSPVDTGWGTALVSPLVTDSYAMEWTATGAGSLDISISLPRSDGSIGLHAFSGVAITAGDVGRVEIDLLSAGTSPVMTIDGDGDGVFEQSVDPAPEVILQAAGPELLSANIIGPETLSGADPFGRAAALLFDREVRPAEADLVANYSVEANNVLSARTQLSGRLVFLFLEQPTGDLVSRDLTVSGLFDTTGRALSTQTLTIGSRMVPPDAAGAIVSGRVLDAFGVPIEGAQVLYLNSVAAGAAVVGLAQQFTGADGRFQFDWVRKADIGPFLIQALDPETNGYQERSTTIRTHGERLVVDLVMRGRGGVTGLVTDLVGDPVPGARVLVTSEVDPGSFALVETDGDGRYTATDIVVGAVAVKAVSGSSSGLASGNLQRAGTFTTVDVTINTGVATVVSRALSIDGADVTSPVPLAPIFYLVPAASGDEVVVASGDTDENGLFVFEDVPTGPFRISAFDLVRGVQASKTGDVVVSGGTVTVNGCPSGECQVIFEEEAVGTITGEVRLASGDPAVGAVVRAGGLQTTTAADGTFQIDSVAAGSLRVRADFGPGRFASALVNLVTGTTVNVSLTLPGVGTVAVTVVDVGGTPMPGHTVIRVTNGCAGYPLTTDAFGVATFQDVPIPGAAFKALKDTDVATGYAAIRRDGDAAAIALRFGGFGTVSGTVVDANDDPVHGADVALSAKVPSPENCSLVRQVRARQMKTGTDGRFQFDNVPIGAVHVSASSFFLPVPTSASDNLLVDGEVKEFTLRLLSNIAGELNGTVYLPDGTTPAGPEVLVTVSGGFPDVTVRTDADGRYAFAKIFPQGRYTVVASDPLTGKVVRELVYLQADQDLTADLRLGSQATVNVTVLDGGGIPVDDAFVEIQGRQYPFFKSAGAITSADSGTIEFLRVPEGRFSVTASDSLGRGGRSFGTVIEDGSVVDITVGLTVTGTVTGTYKTSDGVTPIPNAEITLRQGNGRLLGSTVSSSHPDSLGTFSFDYVPAGDVLVTAMDPLTGRIGEASGVIETQDQIVDLEILQLGLGTITGTVTNAGTPVASAEVQLVSKTGLSSGFAFANLRARATTDGAGGFVFDGVPVGSFELRATVPGLLLVGTEIGFIDTDGQLVDVEIELEASGTLTGDVLRPDQSTGVPAAEITVRPPRGLIQTDADATGRYLSAFVPVGPFTIAAEESSGPDAGIATGELAANETLEVDVVFNGTGTVEGEARDFDDTVLTTGTVRLTRSAPFARDETATVASDGSFRFFGIPVGTYHLSLSVPGEVRRGNVSGEIEVDGFTDLIVVKLADAGSVTGLVVREDGTTPAPNTVIQLRGTSFLLTALTGADGRFDVDGAPLGSFEVWAEDPVTNGLARAEGVLATAGEVVDVGTLVLDTQPIEVESMTPAPGSTVPPDTPLVLRFTDPTEMTRLYGRFFVTSGGANVPGAMVLSTEGLELTFTPSTGGASAFPPSSALDVSLSGFVSDLFGRRMGNDFTSTFSTSGAVVAGTVYDGSAPAAGVNVTLSSSGAGGGSASTVTDASGKYRFEDVLPATITVQAVHPTDGRGSTESRTLAPTEGLVTVDLALAFVGNVTGQVLEHDGVPASEGYEVALTNGGVALATAYTASDGTYSVANVPVGSVTVDVTNLVTGDQGRTTGTVANQQASTLDVTMKGVGSLRLFVRDSTNAAVTTADTRVSFDSLQRHQVVPVSTALYDDTPEADGSYLYSNVLAGSVDAYATDNVSGRAATGAGTVVAGQETTLDIVLQSAGSVRVTVLEPDGATPSPGASVAIRRWNYPLPHLPLQEITSDVSGEVLFESIPVSWGPYDIEVFVAGQLRARARDVSVADGVETPISIVLSGLGTVTGQVLPPSGETLSSSVFAELKSLAEEVGGVVRDYDAADGNYVIENVPVGVFQVTAKDTLNSFQGESAGELTSHGETLVIDVQLADNAITFSIYGNRLYDGNESQYLIAETGALKPAGRSIIDATGEALNLEVSVDGGAPVAFAGMTSGFQEEYGRELVTAVQDIDGVEVQRKVFVPQDGYFARYLEVFDNPGPTARNVTATIESNLTTTSATNGNLDLVSTSSGDLLLDATDLWIVADDEKDQDPFDGSTTGQLATTFVMAGHTGYVPTVDFQPAGIDGVLTTSYDVVVPAGGRAVVMHFVSQESFRDSALAAADRLHQLPPEALVGLDLDEIEAVANFDVPADGVSSVEALPKLDGRLYGQLLAHDGVTGVGANTAAGTLTVRFHSDHVLYRRLRKVNAGADGKFSLETAFGPTSSVVVPRDGFSIESIRTVASSSVTASATSSFTNRAYFTRAEDLSVSATSEFSSGYDAAKAVDGNSVSEWRAATGVTSAALDVSLSEGQSVAVERVRIEPDTAASLSQVQIDLLDESGQLLDSRIESFVSPIAPLTVDVTPAVAGVHRVLAHFDGDPIRINELEVLGTTPADLGNAVQDAVFVGSAGVRIEVTSATGEGIESDVFGRSVPETIQVIGTTTDGDGVKALVAPLPPDVGPVDITVTATNAAVGHGFLEATRQATLTADTTTLASIVYQETGSITAQLTNTSGSPVSGTSVSLFPSEGNGVTETTNASGDALFDYLLPDTYSLRITVGGRFFYSPPIALSAGTSHVENMALPDFGIVDLTVLREVPVGSPEQPVSASVTAIDALGSRTYTTNASGQASITSVPVGGFTIEVTHPDDPTNVTSAVGAVSTSGEVVPFTVTIPALGTVSGTVSYADGGSAALASVELSGASVTPRTGAADGSGAYTFNDVEALRPHNVLARHPATNREHIFALVGSEISGHGATDTVNVSLPGTATVAVTVVAADGTTPIVGANVSILDSFSSVYRAEGTTDANGQTSITIVPEGSFTVRAELLGDEVGTASDTAPSGTVGTVVPVVITAPSEASIEGTIFAADGLTRVAGAPVRLLTADGTTELASEPAASDGTYRFGYALSVGSSSIVRAELPGEPSITSETTVTAASIGETITADLTLAAKVIEGTLYESDGVTPVVGASVEASAEGRFASPSGVDITDSDGSFALLVAADSTYQLAATDPDGLTGYALATVGASDTSVSQDVVLPAFGTVEGTVLDASGSPPVDVAATEVALLNANVDEPRTTLPDATGFYRFERVAQGAFTVVYGDLPTGLSGATTSRLDASGSSGGTVNLSAVFGTVASAISQYNNVYKPIKAVDGNLNTSWHMKSGDSANQGGAPWFEVAFPVDATVTEIRMFGNRLWPNGYDIHAGYFEFFDASGAVLFDSGVLNLPAPDRDIVVVIPSVSAVRRVRFTSTADEGSLPGFSELEVMGELAYSNLSLGPDVTTAAISTVAWSAENRAVDGDLGTSWHVKYKDSANQGAVPFYEIVFPEAAVVSEIHMFGNRQYPSGYDFFAGRFELFDAGGGVLYDSGIVNLPAPDRDVVLSIPDVGGVVKARFTATDDEGNYPGFGELAVYGVYAGPEAPAPDINLPGAGSVSGQLLASGGGATTPTGGTAPAKVRSSDRESRPGVSAQSGAVDSSGAYLVSEVAEGDITVTVVDASGEAASATATVTAGVESTGVDVELGTAEPLAFELGLPAAKRHLVRADGSIEGELDTTSAPVELANVAVNGKTFPAFDAALPELSGRQLVLGPVRMSGIDHTRKIYVPADGAFARFLDVFENPHAFDVEITLALEGTLRASASSLATSSGDSVLDATDRYLAGEIDSGVGVGVVYGGAGAVRLPDAPATDGSSYRLAWRSIVVPAGGRVIFMSFGVQANTASEAETEAAALWNLTDPNATSDLTAAEKADILNFIVP